MSGSHGDLFHEIGRLVLAAHAGQSIDLSAKSEELAERYGNLDMPAELIAKAIARALGAISVSMAIVSERPGTSDRARNGASGHNGVNGTNGHAHANGEVVVNGDAPIEALEADDERPDEAALETQAEAASALFPSGLRLAVLS